MLATSLYAGLAPAAGADGKETAGYLLDRLKLKSSSVLVVDEETGETLAAKNANVVAPIASLTKLMTALVVLDASQDFDDVLEVTEEDYDLEKHTPSRLRIGTELTRRDMLLLALMASENRAASALSRNYPGGRSAFIAAMNAKAKALSMKDSHFADAAGLSPRSVSSARDLHLLLAAANAHPVIRDFSTRPNHTVKVGRRKMTFINSNRLIRGNSWDIEMQKTGFTNEAGRCLVMRVNVAGRKLAMIFLNSVGKLTRYGDASRIRQRLEAERHAKPKSRKVLAKATEAA